MRTHLLTIAALAALLPATAYAQLDVGEVSLIVFENQFAGVPEGWVFQIEINGVGITTATLTPPLRSAINVPGDSTERRFETTPYPSFSALQNDFPPSDAMNKYVITINGTTTLTLDFQPVPPDGFGSFTSPIDGSATLDTTPTFTITNACTNCNVQVVFVETLFSNDVQIESFVFGPPFPTSLDFADFGDNDGTLGMITELPLDTYEGCISAANGTIDPTFADDGQTFELTRAAVAEECIEFGVVPMPDVVEAEIVLGEEFVDGASIGWFFGIELVGSDLLGGTLTPPGGAPLILESDGPGEVSLEVGPFLSLAALQAAFPPNSSGGYAIALNGGVSTVAVDFDPLVPDGGPTITSPTPDQLVGPQPSFVFTDSCTNCSAVFSEIEDENTAGGLVLQQAEFGAPLPTTIDYADFGPNEGSLGPIGELPELFYEVGIGSANAIVTSESFTPADDFDLLTGAFRADMVRFQVPEPSSGALASAALAALAGLGRRRAWRARNRDA